MLTLAALRPECLSPYLARQPVKPVLFLTSLNDFCQIFCQLWIQLLECREIGLSINFATHLGVKNAPIHIGLG
jgi:hypothetical protein